MKLREAVSMEWVNLQLTALAAGLSGAHLTITIWGSSNHYKCHTMTLSWERVMGEESRWDPELGLRGNLLTQLLSETNLNSVRIIYSSLPKSTF